MRFLCDLPPFFSLSSSAVIHVCFVCGPGKRKGWTPLLYTVKSAQGKITSCCLLLSNQVPKLRGIKQPLDDGHGFCGPRIWKGQLRWLVRALCRLRLRLGRPGQRAGGCALRMASSFTRPTPGLGLAAPASLGPWTRAPPRGLSVQLGPLTAWWIGSERGHCKERAFLGQETQVEAAWPFLT